MFLIVLILTIGVAYGSSVDLFAEDVVFSMMATIYSGVEESRKYGNDYYRLFVLWQDADSKTGDCKYCHYGVQDRDDLKMSTDDASKIDYTNEAFLFPTPANSDIPPYSLNKDKLLTVVMKELADLFSGVDVYLNNDSCCHTFELNWKN